ncbi:MAG: alpha/beta hydrolase [Oscillospiraceae bacterium]|nr:alpha/beta hydrolase [Oscillospiraceae bacterium]
MPIIEVNRINLYYEIHGSGEALILIAGLGVDHKIFNSMLSELSQKYKVIVFDNRGAGLSDKPKESYLIEDMSNDVLELLKKLSIEKANVLGLSMGGRIALNLAIEHPEIIEKLILVSSTTYTKKTKMIFSKMIKFIRAKFSKSEQPYYSFKNQLEASRSFNCSDRIENIKSPTLILYGNKDKRLPKNSVEYTHNKIRNSKVIEFKGGHLFFLFKNEEIISEIKNFLSD